MKESEDITYSGILTKEMFDAFVERLEIAHNKRQEELSNLSFPSSEEIAKLDDDRTYNIPFPWGYCWMSGKAVKDLNDSLENESRKHG